MNHESSPAVRPVKTSFWGCFIPASLRLKIFKLYVKVVSQKGSPDFIARGAAIGFFIGLLIPMSGQLIIAIPLAWLLRGSKLAATVCTFITNPWTVVFIYPPQIYLGKIIVEMRVPDQAVVNKMYNDLMESMSHFELFSPTSWMPVLEKLYSDVMIPFFVAGFVLGVIFGVGGYFGTLFLVRRYRALREAHKTQKQMKRGLK